MTKQDFASLKIESLPGPEDIFRTQLKNGITLLVRSNMNSLSVSIAGYLQAGGLYDPQEKLGLSDFTASTLMRGTQEKSFGDIYNQLESIGASLGINSGTHTTGFGGKALADDLPVLLAMLADVLINPIFPQPDIERVRSQLLTGLDLRAQDTGEMASLGFDQLAYKDHPYRFPNDGYLNTIQAIQVNDLSNFHQKHYGPRNMAIVIVGAVEQKNVQTLVEKLFGEWSNSEQPAIYTVQDNQPMENTIHTHHAIDEMSQSDIILGVVGPKRKWPGFYSALLGNSILGQFGMMGRIGESVRNKAGLAYYAYSSLGASIGPGPWTVSAGVAPENLDRAIELIKNELKKFVEQPVTPEELQDVQSNYVGKLPLSLESNSGVASAILTMERHQLGLDYLHHYEKMIRDITPQSILDASREYLDLDRLAISSAG
ncbi:MAG: insulinase family protein, partial [Anaerolineales bacterium]|nr:insulinase family protein [Anaerolineales bacterium]